MGLEGAAVSSRAIHPMVPWDHPGVEAPDPGEGLSGYRTLILTLWVEVEGLCGRQIEEAGVPFLVRHILIQVHVGDQKTAEMGLQEEGVGLLVGVVGPSVGLLVDRRHIQVWEACLWEAVVHRIQKWVEVVHHKVHRILNHHAEGEGL